MLRTRPLPAATLALLLAVLLAPLAPARVAVAWLCEGRICGTTISACCCTAATGRDANCSPGTPNAARGVGDGAALCRTDCNCEMVIAAASEPSPATLGAARAPEPSPLLAVLVPVHAMPEAASAFRELVVAPAEARGPPPPAAGVFARVSPRAPPAL